MNVASPNFQTPEKPNTGKEVGNKINIMYTSFSRDESGNLKIEDIIPEAVATRECQWVQHFADHYVRGTVQSQKTNHISKGDVVRVFWGMKELVKSGALKILSPEKYEGLSIICG